MDVPDNLREFVQYHRRMLALMGMICLGVFIALVAVMRGDFSWSGGFAAGAAAQLAKFGLVDIAVVRKIAVEKKDAAATQLKAMFLSLALFGLAVAAVYKMGWNVWAMAAGIFLPRIVLIADTYIRPNPFGDGDAGDGAPDSDAQAEANGD